MTHDQRPDSPGIAVEGGSGHSIAGRDITQILYGQRQPLQEAVGRELVELDNSINVMLQPAGLLSPTRVPQKDTKGQFRSQKLIESLVQLGVPLGVALEMPFAFKRFLPSILGSERSISTADVRAVVAKILQEGFIGRYQPSEYQRWTTLYLRKYGDPDLRIKVREQDGTESNLDYKFLTERLIPHVIKRTLRIEVEDLIRAELCSSGRINDFAEQLLVAVKALTFTSISYKALLYLAQDLSLELPRPWFVNESNAKRVVRFHLQLAASHVIDFAKYSDQQFLLRKYQLSESIYHSTSAILATYGQYIGIGGGGASAIPYLRKVLLLVQERKMIPYLLIAEIEQHLPSDTPIAALREKLHRTEIRIASCTADRVADLLGSAQSLFALAAALAARKGFE